jgi:hypothetical protein
MCVKLGLSSQEKDRLRMSEDRVLRRISGSMREEIVGSWRKLGNQGLHNSYCSPNVTGMIKS